MPFGDFLGFWRSNASITWITFSDIDFNGVSCMHNFMRRVTCSTYLFPAAPLGSMNRFFFSVQSFHIHCLSSFRKYFQPPNVSKNFLESQCYLEYQCRYYCSGDWHHHCFHCLLYYLVAVIGYISYSAEA